MITQLVTDEEITAAFENTNFGRADDRHFLALSVLKVAVGYHCGQTITTIMLKMRLISGSTESKCTILERGRVFAYEYFLKNAG